MPLAMFLVEGHGFHPYSCLGISFGFSFFHKSLVIVAQRISSFFLTIFVYSSLLPFFCPLTFPFLICSFLLSFFFLFLSLCVLQSLLCFPFFLIYLILFFISAFMFVSKLKKLEYSTQVLFLISPRVESDNYFRIPALSSSSPQADCWPCVFAEV